MSLTKKITDKKVNFEFNKEFINVFNKKIKDNHTEFLNKTLRPFADFYFCQRPRSKQAATNLEMV